MGIPVQYHEIYTVNSRGTVFVRGMPRYMARYAYDDTGIWISREIITFRGIPRAPVGYSTESRGVDHGLPPWYTVDCRAYFLLEPGKCDVVG